MSLYPPELIEEIKRRTNIASVIERFTNLRRSGKNLVGLCPFHQEKSPSFSVNEGKGVFYCFGCQANGDVMSFLMTMRGLSFHEVVEDLARQAGIPLPERKEDPEWQRQRSRRQQLERLQGLVAEFYHRILLKSSKAEGARQYLADRGITNEAIAEFQLGYSPDDWKTLVEFLKKKGASLELAEELGLIGRKSDYYDLFRNRLMFPIIDHRSHVVGFGARALGADDKPKYLNSPETMLFKKGRTLYGLPQAIPAAGRSGQMVFVEGYTDLIKLWQQGIRHVVAPLGTALTSDHLETVQRYAGSVVFLFDGDAAGEKAAHRAVELVLENGIPARMVYLDDGLDPDDFLEQHGPEVLRQRLQDAKPLVGYFLDRAWKQTPKDAPGIADWVRTSLDMVARLRDPIERGLYLKTIAERTNFDEANLRRQIASKLVREAKGESAHSEKQPMRNLARFPNEEVMVLKLLLHYPKLIHAFRDISFTNKFSDPTLRRAAAILLEQPPADTDGVAELPEALYADEELGGHINRWLVEGPPAGIHEEIADQVLLDSLSLIFVRYLEDQVRAKKLELLQADNSEKATAATQEVMRLQTLREGLRSEPSLLLLSRIH